MAGTFCTPTNAHTAFKCDVVQPARSFCGRKMGLCCCYSSLLHSDWWLVLFGCNVGLYVYYKRTQTTKTKREPRPGTACRSRIKQIEKFSNWQTMKQMEGYTLWSSMISWYFIFQIIVPEEPAVHYIYKKLNRACVPIFFVYFNWFTLEILLFLTVL